MPTPTFRKEDDYEFIRGTGVEMCYGIGKIAKMNASGNFKEWGVFTWFGADVPD